jgi:serine/threonine protein kinase
MNLADYLYYRRGMAKMSARSTPLTDGEVIHVAQQICSALRHCNQDYIVHRGITWHRRAIIDNNLSNYVMLLIDCRPENVLLAPNTISEVVEAVPLPNAILVLLLTYLHNVTPLLSILSLIRFMTTFPFFLPPNWRTNIGDLINRMYK